MSAATATWGMMIDEHDTDSVRSDTPRRAADRKPNLIPLLALVFSVIGGTGGAWVGSQSRTAVLESNFASLKDTVKSQGDETRTTLSNLTSLVNNSNQKTGEALAANNKDIEALRREYSAIREEMTRADDKILELLKVQELRVDNMKVGIATIQGELNADRRKKD